MSTTITEQEIRQQPAGDLLRGGGWLAEGEKDVNYYHRAGNPAATGW